MANATTPSTTGTADTKPFVTRDVFRLLVRLEAQKTHEVDTSSLEQRFRVPTGYGKDDTEEQRERLARLITPGPGSYEVQALWAVDGGRNGDSQVKTSAVFASRAPRDPFQLDAIEKASSLPTASRNKSRKEQNPSSSLYLDPPPPLGSFTRANRGLDSPIDPLPASLSELSSSTKKSTTCSAGVSFARVPRATHTPIVAACPLGPAQYEIKRLWDSSSKTGRATPDSPSSAVFSASKDKRDIVWSPAHALPSNAIPEAWNASNHYAKHKRHVLMQRENRLAKDAATSRPFHQQLQLNQSKSMPTLGFSSANSSRRKPPTNADTRARGGGKGIGGGGTIELDPFEWLRRLPQGEQRANGLATKHGLAELVRPVTSSTTSSSGTGPSLTDSAAEGVVAQPLYVVDHGDGLTSESSSAQLLGITGGKRLNDDNDAPSSRLENGSGGSGHSTTSIQKSSEIITVSCRLQGGLVLTVKMYPTKKVRLLKTAIVRKQTRFQNEDQFDLYLGNGKPLTCMDDTLQHVGLCDRALVQVVSK